METQAQRLINLLSHLVLPGTSAKMDFKPDTMEGEIELADLAELANTHHVLVRALLKLQTFATLLDKRFAVEVEQRLLAERSRIEVALACLHPICEALEAQGGEVVVIKSLDHWPDLGSDLDLYTVASQARLEQIMRREFHASPVERSWGDRLGNKWNFRVPGLPELVEVHVRYLGQTGEHTALARRVVERRMKKTLNGFTFHVPAPEERIIISTLQRMYRHFYFRLCDMADVASLLDSKSVDFAELRRAADAGGIWPGVEAFLLLISKYVASFGRPVELPESILRSELFSEISVHFENGFLRVPKLPAAGLYGRQLLSAGAHRDVRAMVRLPLLPPLAISALVAYRLTGSDKGIW